MTIVKYGRLIAVGAVLWLAGGDGYPSEALAGSPSKAQVSKQTLCLGDQCPAPNKPSLEQCHNSCLRTHYLEAAFCGMLPPPANAICHAQNSQNLARCMRECR